MPDSLRVPASRVVPATTAPKVSAPVAKPDPLAVTSANGTSFGSVDGFSITARRDQALKLGADVPERVQDGPTCGLYALGMVMDYWDVKNPKNLAPVVQNADILRPRSHSREVDTPRRLLDVAIADRFTTVGEMFFADNMAKLAREFGYQAKVTSNVTLADLQACVDRHHPALIAFDVDRVGNPGLYKGLRAHWAVIEGHFQKDGVEYLVATHGWEGKEYVWRAADFLASMNQVDTSDFPTAPKDIRECLRAKMIEVYP